MAGKPLMEMSSTTEVLLLDGASTVFSCSLYLKHLSVIYVLTLSFWQL